MPQHKKSMQDVSIFVAPGEKAVVNSSIRLTCFCADELRGVVLSSNYSIVKAEYSLRSLDGDEVIAGERTFDVQPTYEYRLDETLPIDEMVKYEKNEPPFYFLEVKTTLKNGKTLCGALSFAGSLVKGYESTTPPCTDMKERLAAIPIANADMTEDELRQICVDFINLQGEFPYMLPEDTDAYVVSQKKPRTLRKGIVHAGLPYITVGSGSLYRVAEFYDSKTGMIDADNDITKTARIFGNACSGAASIAWSRVVNSARLGYTFSFCASNGCIPVGDYKYDFSIKKFVSKKVDPNGWSCRRVCDENGEQVMYESYALVKPADGGVNDGHIRMFSRPSVVVRNEDGTINGEESYVTMSEQVCYTQNPNHVRIHPDGSHYIAQGYVDIRYTFKNMFDTGYIPFTFAELIGTKKVDKATAEVSVKKDAYNASDLSEITVSANYNVSDLFFTVTDGAGKEIFRCVHRPQSFWHRSFKLSKVLSTETIESIAALSGNTLSIDCQLYNGEKLNALSATVL